MVIRPSVMTVLAEQIAKTLLNGMAEFMDKRGYKKLDDFRGLRRERVVPHSQIKRPDAADYHGGYTEETEGYARPDRPLATV